MTQELAFLNSDSPSTMPAYLAESQDKGLGNENVGSEDQAIPRISLLQALSPQIEEVEGAKTGLFHNSVTDELYEKLFVVNIAYKREYAVFRDRNKGGGFNGSFDSREEANEAIAELPGAASDYGIVETGKHACLIIDPETGEIKQPALLYFKSTALPVSRNWNSQITTIGKDAPRFATIWELNSLKQSNDKGTWYNWSISHAGWVNEDIYNEAKEMHASIATSL